MQNNDLLRDCEIMNKIIEAQRENLDFIQFRHGESNIRIKIKKVYREGIMRGNTGYYSE
jgi:hypothetical protein